MGVKKVAPEQIEPRSLAIIDSEVPEPRPFQGREWIVARRMVHTTADFDLLNHIRFHPRAIENGIRALAGSATIVTDTMMALSGIPVRRLTPLGAETFCLMNDRRTMEAAKNAGVTRARAAVDLALDKTPPPDIWVIGNAPTALIRLLERLETAPTAPALIVGMPVGFVNAEESKDLLLAQSKFPYITIQGRKGGSALAASVINALANMASEGR